MHKIVSESPLLYSYIEMDSTSHDYRYKQAMFPCTNLTRFISNNIEYLLMMNEETASRGRRATVIPQRNRPIAAAGRQSLVIPSKDA